MKTYRTYQELAKDQLIEKEIKIEVANILKIEDYNSFAVYFTRIANNKTKNFRVIKDGEHVRNCLKITYNPYRYTKQDIINLINKNLKIIKHHSHGTCHQHVNKTTLTMILSGVIGPNGLETPEAKSMLNRV